MRNDRTEMHSLLQSIEGIVWEMDAETGRFTFINNQIGQILGVTPEKLLGHRGFWSACVHPADNHILEEYQGLLSGRWNKRSFQYRMINAEGEIVWVKDNVSVIYNGVKPSMIQGIMIDITLTERLLEMERLDGHILRLSSDINVPLSDVLLTYLKGLESIFPQALSCIHHVKNGHLVNSLSPSLPSAYLDTMNGRPIGENEGSCGTAAALRRQVIVGDILTDKKWTKYRDSALQHNLHACWSNPVIDSNGNVIATVSMYYRAPRLPGEEELKVMERATALLQIILENRQKNDIINEANLLMLQSQELAHFGNWRWDIQLDIVSWSPALYTIYGLNSKEFKATFAGYQERLHPDDRARVYHFISNVLNTGQDAEFEERIIRPDGEVRYLRSWAKLKSDASGQPLEMIGACLDVTEKVGHIRAIEQQSQRLAEIAWVQSHVIRSPLANILGLIDIIKDPAVEDSEKNQMLDYLLASARQLDAHIRRICKEVES
ncbi:hypothetical protein DJ568_07700 [Mucilaginibacter hurinus]|uniref:histidine kinase n=1 Tax=Mucilaginibacter hurinus TaxID=2201324 RepID=A0A367GQL5_9SPHI|nr:PAS domain-containing protein [Mucilaginibacter hurinus]RCH55757.1 hypothetical protein DJ568_07700 [Mucilaginibacter hurinus]